MIAVTEFSVGVEYLIQLIAAGDAGVNFTSTIY